MMKYKTVIWDVDGTLLDTHQGVAASVRYSLDKCGVDWNETHISRILNTPKIKGAFMTIMGMSEHDSEIATDIFRNQYKDVDLLKAKRYPGVVKVLETLKRAGINQAIATNKRQDCALTICHHFKLDKYCAPIIGGDRYNSRSKSDLIQDCLDTLGVTDKSSTVMIGDMPADKEAAELLGIDFIGVNYGFGFRDNPKYANSPIDILNKMNERSK